MEQSVTWTLHRSEGVVLVGRSLGPGMVEPNRGPQRGMKIAAIDLNLTLIVSKSGLLHGKDINDWRWWDKNVPVKIRQYALDGYTVIICSNQGRLTELDGSEAPEAAPFKEKMELVMRELQIPVTLFVACANDIYRKPRLGLWSIIPALAGQEGCEIDRAKSIVVGDAAGREGDFSDSDVHWAMNAGIPFNTPEVFFLGEAPKPLGHKFHPERHLGSIENGEEQANLVLSQTLAMVVLVGLPGAGKSTFYRRVLKNAGYVRRDARSYSSREYFILAVDRDVANGCPVIVDDLNIDIESRAVWIAIAAKHGVAVHAVHFTAPASLCLHNDAARSLGGPVMNPDNRHVYPRLHFNDLVSQFQEPNLSEGFHAIHKIDFHWNGTAEELAIWKKFWW